MNCPNCGNDIERQIETYIEADTRAIEIQTKVAPPELEVRRSWKLAVAGVLEIIGAIITLCFGPFFYLQ